MDNAPATRRTVKLTRQLMLFQGVFMAVFCSLGMFLIDYMNLLGVGVSHPVWFYAAFGAFMGLTFPFMWAWLMRRLGWAV